MAFPEGHARHLSGDGRVEDRLPPETIRQEHSGDIPGRPAVEGDVRLHEVVMGPESFGDHACAVVEVVFQLHRQDVDAVPPRLMEVRAFAGPPVPSDAHPVCLRQVTLRTHGPVSRRVRPDLVSPRPSAMFRYTKKLAALNGSGIWTSGVVMTASPLRQSLDPHPPAPPSGTPSDRRASLGERRVP